MSMHDHEKPQLHMVWPPHQHPPEPPTIAGYHIRTYQSGNETAFMQLMALIDFDPWDADKLRYNMAKILPQAWFFAVENTTNHIVGNAMCLHNYGNTSPFWGDVGWIACHPDHRGHGLGYALTAHVTKRFCEAGYLNIQLHTEYYRLSAIKTYLKLGYLPIINDQAMDELWQSVCQQIHWPFTPELWLRDIPNTSLT